MLTPLAVGRLSAAKGRWPAAEEQGGGEGDATAAGLGQQGQEVLVACGQREVEPFDDFVTPP